MTKELDFCKSVFKFLGKVNGIILLEESNLNDRETILLIHRFIRGLSIKEVAELNLVEEDTINKWQLRTCKKLYDWLNMKGGFDYVLNLENKQIYRQLCNT